MEQVFSPRGGGRDPGGRRARAHARSHANNRGVRQTGRWTRAAVANMSSTYRQLLRHSVPPNDPLHGLLGAVDTDSDSDSDADKDADNKDVNKDVDKDAVTVPPPELASVTEASPLADKIHALEEAGYPLPFSCPSEFLCRADPTSLLTDPVAPDQFPERRYNRDTLMRRWDSRYRRFPDTGEPIRTRRVRADPVLRARVERWVNLVLRYAKRGTHETPSGYAKTLHMPYPRNMPRIPEQDAQGPHTQATRPAYVPRRHPATVSTTRATPMSRPVSRSSSDHAQAQAQTQTQAPPTRPHDTQWARVVDSRGLVAYNKVRVTERSCVTDSGARMHCGVQLDKPFHKDTVGLFGDQRPDYPIFVGRHGVAFTPHARRLCAPSVAIAAPESFGAFVPSFMALASRLFPGAFLWSELCELHRASQTAVLVDLDLPLRYFESVPADDAELVQTLLHRHHHHPAETIRKNLQMVRRRDGALETMYVATATTEPNADALFRLIDAGHAHIATLNPRVEWTLVETGPFVLVHVHADTTTVKMPDVVRVAGATYTLRAAVCRRGDDDYTSFVAGVHPVTGVRCTLWAYGNGWSEQVCDGDDGDMQSHIQTRPVLVVYWATMRHV